MLKFESLDKVYELPLKCIVGGFFIELLNLVFYKIIHMTILDNIALSTLTEYFKVNMG